MGLRHTDIMKTVASGSLNIKFDIALACAGDEEKSRAKERIFSFRTAEHRWDLKNQRPEIYPLYNTCKKPGETMRVFPSVKLTELDIWQYILSENIDTRFIFSKRPPRC